MKRIPVVAVATFQELVRQPAWLLLGAGGVVFIVLLAHTSYFALGEEARQVQQSALAFLWVAGLLAAVLGASSSVAREVRTGTALVVLSKPVARWAFLLGKFLGLAAALGIQVLTHLQASLLAGRMARGVERSPDWPAISALLVAVMAALTTAAMGSYFARRNFVGDAVRATTAATTAAFVGINFVDRAGAVQSWGAGLDWRLLPAGLLILIALLMICGVALAFSTRLEMVPTLALCTGVLLLGLLSDYLFSDAAAAGSRLAQLAQAIVPNWQVFWAADALGGSGTVPWGYVARASLYGVLHLGVALSAAFFLFSDRELN